MRPRVPPGNDSGGECGVSVAKRFSMPGTDFLAGAEDATNGTAGGDDGQEPDDAGLVPGPAANRHHIDSNPPFWYSYDYGSVHFTVISTEHDLEEGSEQYKVLGLTDSLAG
jgi:acid phosphatase type 7